MPEQGVVDVAEIDSRGLGVAVILGGAHWLFHGRLGKCSILTESVFRLHIGIQCGRLEPL